MVLLPLKADVGSIKCLEISISRKYLACIEVLQDGSKDQVSTDGMRIYPL